MARRNGKSIKASKKRAALKEAGVNACSTASILPHEQTKPSPGTYAATKRSFDGEEKVGRKRQRVPPQMPAISIKEALKLQQQEKLMKTQLSDAADEPTHSRGVGVISDEDSYRGLDCEMVGTGANGKRSVLARACVVDFKGAILYDAFVKVDERVTDFRTQFSGVRPRDLKSKDAVSFKECVTEVARLLKGKILVGHALRNDLKVLMLSHPRHDIRDTATYRPFMRYVQGKFRPRKLKDLAKEHLGLEIQGGEHTPDEDAGAAMALYCAKRREWEAGLRIFRGNTNKRPKAKAPRPEP